MARTRLVLVGSALFWGSLGSLAPACAPETFTFSGSPDGGALGGGGSSGACEPLATQPCYSGPMDSLGIGVCKGGTAACLMDGSGFGACEGQVVPSFDDCATPADEDCDSAAPACSGAHVWSQRWGDAAVQRAYGVAVDAEGNSVVVGELAGALGVGDLISMGLSDVFAVKLDPAGGVVWARRWGDSMAQTGTGVAIDPASGDVYVTGTFTGSVNFGTGTIVSAGGRDVFIVKLDKDGSVVWSKGFGDDATQGVSDIAVSGGRLAIAGSFNGKLDLGAGQVLTSAGLEDGYLAVLSAADGAAVWSIGFGDADIQVASRVKFGPSGSVYMAGYGEGMVNFGDGLRSSAGLTDAYLVKFAPDGGVVWSRLIGGVGNDQGFALGITSDEGVVVGGASTGTIDFGGGPAPAGAPIDMFLAKYQKSGVFSWARRFGTESMQASGLAVDGANNIIVTGIVTGNVDFGKGVVAGNADVDGFVAKLTAAGDALWGINFGAAGGSERGNDVAAGPHGEVLLVGHFDNKITFAGAPALVVAGGNDAFAARLSP